MITVTKPYLPDLNTYQGYIQAIFERRWLTNFGPLVNELEEKITQFTGVPNLYLGNGTIAIQLAIKALGITGEVITTPFSYVATTSSVLWEGCTPVFADILPDTCNIDPSAVEKCITPATTAILATHVYGIPCDVERLEQIALKHGLKVIYDGAHAFGVRYKGKSLLAYGDMTTCSYHATKLFHTVEGGGVFSTKPEVLKQAAYMRNFGHEGPEDFVCVGINAKNSEFHAAMGLSVLPDVPEIIQKREQIAGQYKEKLKGLSLGFPKIPDGTTYNFAYFPVFFPDEASLLRVKQALEGHYVSTRRYFYPSLNNLRYLTHKQPCPVAEDLSLRVLCLPMYPDLKKEEVDLIANLVRKFL